MTQQEFGGDWTQDKLARLKGYLEAYMQIFKKRPNLTPIYVDAFAGTGSQAVVGRVRDLQQVPASVRFLSVEPLIGAIEELPLQGIHWVIVGGESGPGARPMKREWVEAIYHQCRRAEVPFFFKQWGGTRKDLTGRELHGRTYDEMPDSFRKSTDLSASSV